jgi:hypothetical protein
MASCSSEDSLPLIVGGLLSLAASGSERLFVTSNGKALFVPSGEPGLKVKG